MNYCMDAAVDRGTGTAADMKQEMGMAVAGKTGTPGSNRDRYFAGFTGHYTAAVWCGFDTPQTIELSGNKANPAARLWKKVMLPLHKGLPSIELFDRKNMVEVPICLDSGKHATDSCYRDVRSDDGLSRVERVLLYPEDVPSGFCDKHISLDYCVEGHGVANSYCKKLRDAGALKLEQKALLKITQTRLDTLLKAKGKGLVSEYLRNDYIYLVDGKGKDKPFFGINGDINKGLDVPYQVCREHTRQDWEQFVESTRPTVPPTTVPPATQPTQPSAPSVTLPPTSIPPTTMTAPTQPTQTQPGAQPSTEPTDTDNTDSEGE